MVPTNKQKPKSSVINKGNTNKQRFNLRVPKKPRKNIKNGIRENKQPNKLIPLRIIPKIQYLRTQYAKLTTPSIRSSDKTDSSTIGS